MQIVPYSDELTGQHLDVKSLTPQSKSKRDYFSQEKAEKMCVMFLFYEGKLHSC